MAVLQFSALSSGQAIGFNPLADVLNFDQPVIAAADLRVSAAGANTRIEVIGSANAGKAITLLDTELSKLSTTNLTFADGSRLLFGDNSTAGDDNASQNLSGGAGRDLIAGFGGNDTLLGGDGADVFVLSSGTAPSYGADSINGGLGFDLLDFTGVALSAVAVSLSAGTLSGGGSAGAGSATLSGVDGAIGGQFNDTLLGSGAANRLEGGAGNDSLSGSAGNDTLRGGAGVDTLNGGSGNDQFVFAEAPSAADADLLVDFASGADKLVLDRAAFGALGAGDFAAGDARFAAGAGFTSGRDASDRVIYDTSTGQLYYDADGNGAGGAQLITTLQGLPAIAATDITVIGEAPVPPPPSNVIQGTAGNDSLTGTDGSDAIDGLAGDDTLVGGHADDSLSGGSGNDALIGNNGADLLRGGDGDDTLNGATGSFDDFDEVEPTEAAIGDQPLPGDTLEGGLGNDLFLVQENDVIADAGGIDTVLTDQSTYTLPAGFENLTYRPFHFSDGEGKGVAYIGNELDNTIRIDSLFTESGASFKGGDGNDMLIGGQSADSFEGGAGNDTMIGGGVATLGNADRFSGGAGDDRLVSSELFDSLLGGTGADSFVFARRPGGESAPAIADFVSGTDKIVLDGNFHARIGSSGNFTADDPRFHAAPGATAASDATDRVIYNTSTGELFYDADGTAAEAPQSVAVLQPGTVLVATDIAVENPSALTIIGTAGNDTLRGFGGDDTLIGGDGADVFILSSGTAVSYGADSINGGLGFDVVDFTGVAWSPVTVNLSAGTLSGGDSARAGSATLSGIDGAIGGAFSDTLIGSGAANRLVGGDGHDSLSGSAGNDTLRGGTGVDTLNGGSGNDQFVFAEAPGAANADLVIGFASGADRLVLDRAAFGALGAGDFAAGDARFAAGAGFTSGRDASDRVIYDMSTGQLYYDADGSGAGGAQLIATLQGLPAIAASDITVL